MTIDNSQTVSTLNNIPLPLYSLFWEYDPKTLDVMKHADVIIARIMERGGWTAMDWLRQTYSQERLVAFLEARGKCILPPRELNYWAFICDIPPETRELWVQHARRTSDVWRNRYAHRDSK